jgi:Leucine-rich repeat (LRR) protein
LILNDNNLRGSLPPELVLLGENLQELDLSFNSLTRVIPSDIARLTGLTRLVLQSNSLTGSAIPLEMSALTRLSVFDVNLNRELAGGLPSEIDRWTDLRKFNVESTNMNGALPSAIGKWTNLENWYSRRVKWDGTIPSEVGLMSSLKVLDFSGAGGSMYGPIPEEIYNITSLTWLGLTRTGVQGTISTAISTAI